MAKEDKKVLLLVGKIIVSISCDTGGRTTQVLLREA